MEEDTIIVLFDLGRHFEVGEDDGRRLRLGQCGMLEGMCAQGLTAHGLPAGDYALHGVAIAHRSNAKGEWKSHWLAAGWRSEAFLGVKLVDPTRNRVRWEQAQAVLAQW